MQKVTCMLKGILPTLISALLSAGTGAVVALLGVAFSLGGYRERTNHLSDLHKPNAAHYEASSDIKEIKADIRNLNERLIRFERSIEKDIEQLNSKLDNLLGINSANS